MDVKLCFRLTAEESPQHVLGYFIAFEKILVDSVMQALCGYLLLKKHEEIFVVLFFPQTFPELDGIGEIRYKTGIRRAGRSL